MDFRSSRIGMEMTIKSAAISMDKQVQPSSRLCGRPGKALKVFGPTSSSVLNRVNRVVELTSGPAHIQRILNHIE